jgi:nucleotide-binding universal stress UspA family protein
MGTISRILVGVDFDDASASVLHIVGALAAAWNATVTVVHSAVQDVPPYFTASQFDDLEAEREQSRAAIRKQLRAFAAQHAPTAVDLVVGEGPPEETLLKLAASFDLVAVGTHRRHGPQRWWLGSVAEAVVRHSPRPVLVVPDGAVAAGAPGATTILAAGGQDASAEAWVDALKTALDGTVVRAPDIRQCAPDRVRGADLIVLAMAPSDEGHGQVRETVQVLKECAHPVLFVRSAGQRDGRITSPAALS